MQSSVGKFVLPYSLLMLWRDRYRYLPALLAVGFRAVLIAVQCGLVRGLLLCTSVPIDESSADIWVLAGDAPSLQQSVPIPEWWQLRLTEQPEITRAESYLLGDGLWHKPNRSSSEYCFLIGSRMDDNSLGVVRSMPPAVRQSLTEPGTVAVDDWELRNLGLERGTGELGEVNGQRVKVVGTVHGFQGHNFIYLFCSMQTARQLLPHFQQTSSTLCILGQCRKQEDIPVVVERLRRLYPDMGVYSREELSLKAHYYWLFRSTGGTVMVCTIILALLVGLVVTSQTLYAAGLAALREYAVLDALGIPRGRMVKLVLTKSFWIGAGGIILALPTIHILSWAAVLIHTPRPPRPRSASNYLRVNHGQRPAFRPVRPAPLAQGGAGCVVALNVTTSGPLVRSTEVRGFMAHGVSLKASQLTRTYGSGETLTVALRDISLELSPGELTLAMGPSGCGKSTLLAIVSGLLQPDSGQVLVKGQDLYQMGARERREFRLRHFGFIFQEFHLFPTLTVWEQLEMVLRWGQGMSRREAGRRITGLLEQLNIMNKAHHLPTQLSGGEKQRVAIARAFIKAPEFCFADEPTSALDWGQGKHVVEILQEIGHEHGATVLVVSHNPRIPRFRRSHYSSRGRESGQ